MSQSRVDLLVLAYDNPGLEAEMVESVLWETKWPYRLVVYDNRSGTKNMAKLWNRFIFDSPFEYVCILDSDVRVDRLWLSTLMETMLLNPRAGAVVPVTEHCNERDQCWTLTDERPRVPFVCRDGMISGFCFLIRKDVMVDVGPFDEAFRFYGQDTDWFCRMALTTRWDTWVDPRVQMFHQGQGSTNATSKDYDFKEDKRHALKLFFYKLETYKRQGDEKQCVECSH